MLWLIIHVQFKPTVESLFRYISCAIHYAYTWYLFLSAGTNAPTCYWGLYMFLGIFSVRHEMNMKLKILHLACVNTPRHLWPWDFNHGTLESTLPTFHQFAVCITWQKKTFNLLNANVATALPSLCISDHNMIALMSHAMKVLERLVLAHLVKQLLLICPNLLSVSHECGWYCHLYPLSAGCRWESHFLISSVLLISSSLCYW